MKVYIAGPLTKGNRIENIRNAFLVASTVMSFGHTPFVPHHYDFMELIAGTCGTYEDFMRVDFEWLELCDVIIRIPGESLGADREVIRMLNLGRKVYMGIEEFLKEHGK